MSETCNTPLETPRLSTHGVKLPVPPEIFDHWRRSYRHGDCKRAATKSGYSRVVIQHALLYGFAQEPVQLFLTQYFNGNRRD